MRQVQRVAGAGVVHIGPPAPGQTVIAGIVQPAKAQRRAPFIAFGGMVVDHVQNDLDPGGMEPADHGLKFPQRASAHVAGFRRKERKRVVAPVVPQPLGHQKPVVDESLHRHQFDCGDAKTQQMVDHRIGTKAQIRAAQMRVDAGMKCGKALDMRLVDQRFGRRGARCSVTAPTERRVDDHRFGHRKGAVAGVIRQIATRAADLVAHHRVRPFQPPLQRAGVGVQQQLVRIEPVPVFGRIGAVRAKAVNGAQRQPADMDVPDIAIAVAQRQAGQLLAAIG